MKIVSERDPKKGLPYQVQDPKTKRKWYVGADEVTWPQPPATTAEEVVAPVVPPPVVTPAAADDADVADEMAEVEALQEAGIIRKLQDPAAEPAITLSHLPSMRPRKPYATYCTGQSTPTM